MNLIVASRQNVLLVPYAAVTTQNGQKYVEVVSATGATEKRAVTTGITDYSSIEITGGLNEGDQIIVTSSTAAKSTSSSSTNQQQGNNIIIPGMGGPPAGGPPGG